MVEIRRGGFGDLAPSGPVMDELGDDVGSRFVFFSDLGFSAGRVDCAKLLPEAMALGDENDDVRAAEVLRREGGDKFDTAVDSGGGGSRRSSRGGRPSRSLRR